MKLNAKNVLVPAFILCLICIVVSGILVLTNDMTKGIIAQAQAQKEEETRMVVLPSAENFEESQDGTYFIGKKNDEVVGYVFLTESKGYSSTVKVMTGIGTDSQIAGVVIVSQNETPGLGSNSTNPSFTEQYNQTATQFDVVKVPATEGQITALTGATITSKAVTDAVNQATEIFSSIKEAE